MCYNLNIVMFIPEACMVGMVGIIKTYSINDNVLPNLVGFIKVDKNFGRMTTQEHDHYCH